MVLIILIVLILAFVVIAAYWKLFELAERPGLAALIPIYNIYIMLEIAGLEWWWILILILSPIVPIIGDIVALGASFYIIYKFVESYGKDLGFAIGAFFLSFIFIPILAFDSKTKYLGPAAKKNATTDTTNDTSTQEQQTFNLPADNNYE